VNLRLSKAGTAYLVALLALAALALNLTIGGAGAGTPPASDESQQVRSLRREVDLIQDSLIKALVRFPTSRNIEKSAGNDEAVRQVAGDAAYSRAYLADAHRRVEELKQALDELSASSTR
jgi:hypothetical protein